MSLNRLLKLRGLFWSSDSRRRASLCIRQNRLEISRCLGVGHLLSLSQSVRITWRKMAWRVRELVLKVLRDLFSLRNPYIITTLLLHIQHELPQIFAASWLAHNS
jgi:hypothetical protein